MDLVSFHFSSFLSFFSIYFPFILFLVPRVRVSDNIGHLAQRRFQKNDVIPHADLMADT